MARSIQEFESRRHRFFLLLIAIGLLACEFSRPLPIDNSGGVQPPPTVPAESDPNLGESESSSDTEIAAAAELTEQQRAVLQQIADLYASRNLPCPYDEQNILMQALPPGVLPVRHAAIKSHLSDEQLGQLRFALGLLPALLGTERSQEVLWEFGLVGQSASALQSPTLELLGSVGVDQRRIDFTEAYFQHSDLQRKLTFLHELLHLLDLAPRLFDADTLLQLKLIATQFIFENGGPVALYEQLYLDENHASENFISTFGSLFVDRLDDFLPADQPQTAVIIDQVARWRDEKMTQVLNYKVGELLLETRQASEEYHFSPEGEAILRQLVEAMTKEAFAEALSRRTLSALAFDQSPEQSAHNAELIAMYFTVAGSRDFADLAAVQKLFFAEQNTEELLSVDQIEQ